MFSITNFTDYPTLSTSEVISRGDLKSHMTSHGLGSGIYGFINPLNSSTSLYKSCKNKTLITMDSPYIISTTNHLSCFSFFSTILNEVVSEIKDNICKIGDVVDKFESFGFEFTDSSIVGYDEDYNRILLFESIGRTKLLYSIEKFIDDYNLLETMTGDNYIVSPINYLLHGLYDGIYNEANDTASVGSVKYIYTNPRSFIASKKSTLLSGYLLSFR